MVYNFDQNGFIEKLKNCLIPYNRETVGEGFYEWKIEDWTSLSRKKKVIHSPKFEACGYTWRLQLFANGDPNVDYSKKYISIYLERLNPEKDFSVHIPLNRVFYIRNYYDDNCFYYKSLPVEFYSFEYNAFGIPQLIKKTELNTKDSYTNKTLLEKNKCVFGIYFHKYNYNIETDFKNELICAWDNEPANNDEKHMVDEIFYEMKIENWSKLPKCKLSPEFTLGNHKWNLELHKNGYGSSYKNFVSYYINCIDFSNNENDNDNEDVNDNEEDDDDDEDYKESDDEDDSEDDDDDDDDDYKESDDENDDDKASDNEDEETGVCIKYALFLRNYNCKECFSYGGFDYKYFNDKNPGNGFNQFLKKVQLTSINKKANKPLLENKKCVIGVYARVYEEGNDDGEYNTLSNMVNNMNIGNNNNNNNSNVENYNGYPVQNQTQVPYNYPPIQYPQGYNYPQDYNYPPNQFPQDYNYPPNQYPQDYNYPPNQYPQDYNYPPNQYPQDYNYPPNGPPIQPYYYQEQNDPYYYRNQNRDIKSSTPSKEKDKSSK